MSAIKTNINNFGPSGPAADGKPNIKGRVLIALTRLNDKDTQRFAVEELFQIVRDLDHDSLPTIVSCLCSTGLDQKPFARKECIRALALLVSEGSHVWQAALQQYTGKILALVRKGMQDADSGVRDASSEAVASLAQGLYSLAGGALPGSFSHPIVRLVFDCLGEQRKECQAAAGQALLMAAPFLGPIDKEVLRDVLKALKSPTFQAGGSLLAALGCSDVEQHQYLGLLKSGPSAFTPYTSHLIGQPASGSSSGSGMLGCLAHKEWTVRRAAADALKVAAALLGPHLEPDGCWDRSEPRSVCGRACKALEACKFDKVKEVREVVRDALALFEELLAWGQQGGGAEEWQRTHVPAAAGDGVGASPSANPSSGPSPMSGPSQRRLSFTNRAGSISERFKRAQTPTDIVAEPSVKSRPGSATPPSQDQAPESGRRLSTGGGGGGDWRLGAEPRQLQFAAQPAAESSPPVVQLYGRPQLQLDVGPGSAEGPGSRPAQQVEQQQQASYSGGRRYSRSATPSGSRPASRRGTGEDVRASPAAAAAAAGTVAVPAAEWSALQQRLQQLEAGQQAAAALAQQVADGALVTQALQARVELLEAALAGLSLTHAAVAPAEAPAALAATPAAAVPTAATRHVRALSSAWEEHSVLQGSGGSSSAPARGLPDVPGPQACLSPDRVSSDAAAGTRLRMGAESVPPPAVARALRLKPSGPMRTASLPGTASDAAADMSPDGVITASTPTSAGDLDAAFSRALRDGSGDMHLARLLQRTGIVWNALSTPTCTTLLTTFIRWLHAGTLVKVVLKWLWRLADDENCSYEVPLPLRAQLLDGLRGVSGLEEPQDTERLQDLLNTLAILWASTAMPSPRPSSPTLGSGSGQRGLAVRRRPSVEGLTALHGELAQMQRQLQEVGQQGSRAASPLPEA